MRGGVEKRITVLVAGKNVEQFITGALKEEHISIKSIKCGETISQYGRSMILSIKASEFASLRPLALKYHCHVHILNRSGILFKLNAYRYRPVLLFGWILSLAVLIALSRFIWYIDVNGCNKTSPDSIRSTLKELGVVSGSVFDVEDTDEIKTAILSDPNISWVDVTRHGVRLLVDIVETNGSGTTEDSTDGVNIYSSDDGVVTNITVYSGHAKVSVGDVVKRGDILISGDLSTEEREVYTIPRGEVRARVLRQFSYTESPTALKRMPTGNKTERTELSLYNLNLAQSIYEDFDTEELSQYTLKGCFIPIVFHSQICHEMAVTECTLTKDEMIDKASKEVEALMMDGLSHSTKILSKSTETKENSDGSISYVISLTVEENICS